MAKVELRGMIASTSSDAYGIDVYRYRLTLQYEDSQSILKIIADGQDEIDTITPATRSVENITNAYRLIKSILAKEFGRDEVALRHFYAYFTRNVKLIRVTTVDITKALKVFETINDRGVGLDSMDLLKNLLFMYAAPPQFDGIKDTWKALVDTLFGVNEKPLRFLRYFIFSRYDVDRLREDEIYKWFLRHENECGYKAHP